MPTDNDSEWVTLASARLDSLAERQARTEQRLENLEAGVGINNKVTAEIYEILTAAKGAFKFFSWMGQFAGWALRIGAAAAALYASMKVAFPHLFKS